MLTIKDLHKSYKGYHVLRGLDMNVEKGDVYGFLGQNGCGKTTTMNIICNIIKKDSGEITFTDDKINIGYLPESPALYDYMNGYEYLDFIAACCEFEGDIHARTTELLDITRMKNDANRLIKGYSRGMNQRIGIAAALYANPDLLILDEPTSALDPAGRAEVMDIINTLTKSGVTIILCTHILGDVERVANKVGIIRNGVMAIEGSLDEIKHRFSDDNAVTVRCKSTSDVIEAAKELDILERHETDQYGDVTFIAKPGVTEAEIFYKLATALGNARIIPDGIWFRRLSLEQIYLGITSGYLLPDTAENTRAAWAQVAEGRQ